MQCGGGDPTRTGIPQFCRPLLYQLSYAPIAAASEMAEASPLPATREARGFAFACHSKGAETLALYYVIQISAEHFRGLFSSEVAGAPKVPSRKGLGAKENETVGVNLTRLRNLLNAGSR
jgi:hypothetical protein